MFDVVLIEMKKFLLLVGCCVFLFSCKQKSGNVHLLNLKSPEGNYLNYSFLNFVKDSLPQNAKAYCIEIIFDHSDSAEFSNGFENFFLRWKRKGDTLTFKEAYCKDGKVRDLNALLVRKNEIEFLDQPYTGQPRPSVFRKLEIENHERWKFSQALNSKLMAGSYSVLSIKRNDTLNVNFQEDGLLTGWENYTEYEICYAGDCLGESKEPGNLLYLHNLKGKIEPFLMTSRKQEGIFELYALGPSNPEIKGQREKGNLTYIMQKSSLKKPSRSKGVF